MNTHCDTTQGGRLLFARAVPQDLPEMAELEKLCFDDPWTLGMLEEGLFLRLVACAGVPQSRRCAGWKRAGPACCG